MGKQLVSFYDWNQIGFLNLENLLYDESRKLETAFTHGYTPSNGSLGGC